MDNSEKRSDIVLDEEDVRMLVEKRVQEDVPYPIKTKLQQN